MTQEIIIQQVNHSTFESQKYIPQDENIISSFYLDTSFSFETDYVEVGIYDENQNLIISYDKQDDSESPVINGDVILEPSKNLSSLGYDNGLYFINYNFFRKRLNSDPFCEYYIEEINSDRTEIRLASSILSNQSIIDSTNLFVNYRSTENYFVDFYLNFGNNNLIIANNIKLDNTLEDPTVLVKLYEPLPLEYSIKDLLWIVEPISDPQTYSVEFPFIPLEITDYENVKGPNFSLNIKEQIGSSTQVFTFNELFGSNISSSQQQISSILSHKGIDINTNYEDFSNFVHFSSAKTRLENFYYKMSSIEVLNNELSNFLGSISGSTSSSFAYNSSYNSISSSIDKIINEFDGYENFMYFNSGSLYSWPKTTSQPPYILAPTGSVDVWFENNYNLASSYDENNLDYLYWTIPEYLRNDSENDNYKLFLDMIGQHFDSIWVYIDSISDKFNADNRLNYGISKNLVADTIKDFGIKLYSNNYNINDLYTSLLGITPSGSIFPFPDITETLPASSGKEYIDEKIYVKNPILSSYGTGRYSAVNYVSDNSYSNIVYPLGDISKNIYKRIYHNLPYLLKTKGTITGLRALITLFGIPDTILRINEFGGKDRNNSGDWDYEQNVSNYAFSGSLTTGFLSNSNLGDTLPETIQFRFKTDGSPVSGSQELFSSYDGATKVSSITIEYINSGLLSGSYSGSIPDLENQYGIIKYNPNIINNEFIELYLPIFNNDWWNIQANFDHQYSKIYLYAANKIDGKIGFKASYSYDYVDYSYYNYTPTTSSLTSFKGQFQEYRLFNTIISENAFYDYVLNPLSCEGNSINGTSNELFFRAPLGSNLDIDSRTSIHPKVTGSWAVTSSFPAGSSFNLNGSFIPNVEKIYYDQPIAGIKNSITDKINIENMVLPEGDTLSPFQSIQQKSFISSSYTPDINYLEIAFSPQDQINEDIMSQIGYLNIGEYIGDPRQINNDGNSYPDLNRLRDEYFEKYIHNYSLNDFIRLMKYFDNSLFKMLKDFIPAKTDLATGIIIKQHLLERNKHKPAQLSYEDELYTASIKNLPNNYEKGELFYNVEGGNGGSFSHLSAVSQSWSQSLQFPYNPTSSANNTVIRSDKREYFNGELPGSYMYTQMTEHCQKYKSGDIEGFEHDYDCQPNLNNVDKIRLNPNIQDVDYSIGIDHPVNISQIKTNTATRGTVPESNYTLKRHKGPRYDGSKVLSDGVNLSTGLTGSYDNYPPVESKKTHFAYISEIKDPYPVVNDKTYVNVKYIIDTETNIDNPSLSDITFYNMKNIFTPDETINSSLVIPKQEPQFNKLNNVQDISHIGEIAVPILYSQTASNGWALEIPMSASNQNSSLGMVNYKETAYETTMSNLFLSDTGSFYISVVKISSSIVYDSSNTTNEGSILTSGIISASNLDSNYNISWKIKIPSTVPQTTILEKPIIELYDIDPIYPVEFKYIITSDGGSVLHYDGICYVSGEGTPTISSNRIANNDQPEVSALVILSSNEIMRGGQYSFRAYVTSGEFDVTYSSNKQTVTIPD